MSKPVTFEYLSQSDAEFDMFYRRTRNAHPLLYQKLEKARQQTMVQS
jgi:hypothetical protein